MPAYVQLLVVVAAFVLFWAVVMRPARNQQRQTQRVQSELAVGDEVVISAGIFGTIRSLDDQRVQLEIAPGTVVTVARQVVVRRASEVDDRAPGAGPHTGPGPDHPESQD